MLSERAVIMFWIPLLFSLFLAFRPVHPQTFNQRHVASSDTVACDSAESFMRLIFLGHLQKDIDAAAKFAMVSCVSIKKGQEVFKLSCSDDYKTVFCFRRVGEVEVLYGWADHFELLR